LSCYRRSFQCRLMGRCSARSPDLQLLRGQPFPQRILFAFSVSFCLALPCRSSRPKSASVSVSWSVDSLHEVEHQFRKASKHVKLIPTGRKWRGTYVLWTSIALFHHTFSVPPLPVDGQPLVTMLIRLGIEELDKEVELGHHLWDLRKAS